MIRIEIEYDKISRTLTLSLLAVTGDFLLLLSRASAPCVSESIDASKNMVLSLIAADC